MVARQSGNDPDVHQAAFFFTSETDKPDVFVPIDDINAPFNTLISFYTCVYPREGGGGGYIRDPGGLPLSFGWGLKGKSKGDEHNERRRKKKRQKIGQRCTKVTSRAPLNRLSQGGKQRRSRNTWFSHV